MAVGQVGETDDARGPSGLVGAHEAGGLAPAERDVVQLRAGLDALHLEQQLTEDERMIRDAAHAYAQDKLLPRVQEAFRKEHTDPAIFREMG